MMPGARPLVMDTSTSLQQWEQPLDELLADYQHRIAYGNLRSQRSQWTGSGVVVNFALVYELPGGSSSQINIEYHAEENHFRFLDVDTAEERVCGDPAEALQMLRESIARIPARRLQRLREDIDRWFGQGKSSRDMFLEINKLLQTDFKGGSLTHQELKAGIGYILALGKQNGNH